MKKLISILSVALVMLATTGAQAQKTELGLMIGAGNYMGDLTPSVSMNETHLAVGGFYRHHFNPYINLKVSANSTLLTGTDANQADAQLQSRNLSFRSRVFEAGAQVEYNIFSFNPSIGGRRFSPYVFAGVAGFYHNPYTFYNGAWVELQPLGTEGQGSSLSTNQRYSRVQIALPMGAGVKLALMRCVFVGAELGFRKTFTDYIDDVSTQFVDPVALADENGALAAELSDRSDEVGAEGTFPVNSMRGNPLMKDWYIIGGVNVSVLLGGDCSGKKSNGKGRAHKGGKINLNKSGCYTF